MKRTFTLLQAEWTEAIVCMIAIQLPKATKKLLCNSDGHH